MNEDVTERRQAQAALHRALAAADAANQAKTEFLANMSHEIRTPMNAILGLVYLLQKTGLNPRQWDYAGKVQNAATSLLDILNDILDFSKVEAGRMELEQVPFRLDHLLRDMSVILSANSQEKDIEVLFRVGSDVPDRLVGDPLRLRQVLINLAGNAVKFTDRGEVVLSVSLASVSSERAQLQVSIRDTGIGIDADDLQRIFEGFTQAEASTGRRFGGTGLGLAISSRLVRLMGGEIEVSSAPGEGSEFRFSVVFGLAPAAGAGAGDAVSPGAAPLRLLVADDNPTAREALAQMIASFGWSAQLAEDGRQALGLLEESLAGGRGYDAVLIDWRMPGVEGVEAGRRIRRLCRERGTPLVVLATSYGREAALEARRGEPGPVDCLLLKPLTASMLLDAVADASRGYQLMPAGSGREFKRRLQGLRILLVEDNKVNQLVAREILEGEGARVVVADDGREAVARVRDGEARFDAVLMDLQMPVMDGYQATGEIRNALGEAALPIIAMTANAFEADRQRCLEAGLNAHLTKPIQVELLVETLGCYCVLNESEQAASTDHRGEPFVLDDREIAGLPGLDLGNTLKRLNGNRLLYSQIARMVCGRYQEVGEQMTQLLAAGDAAAASELLHTFKGVALNMGAFALSECVQELEKALAQKEHAAGLRQLRERFQALLAEALSSLEIVADRYGEPAVGAGKAGLPPAAVLDHLQRLMAFLEESNMEAVDCFGSFRQQFTAILPAERMQWIAEAIEQLDFCAAFEYCSVLNAVLQEETP